MCPHEDCEQDAEVYSRITGYYRPVRNWNDGKSQEFLDRKEYVIDLNAQPVRANTTAETVAAAPEAKPAAGSADAQPEPVNEAKETQQLLLFTTPTCANCAMVKKSLANAGIAHQVVDAAERQDLVEKYGVRQAPSLVAVSQDGAKSYAGPVKVMEYIKTHAVENTIA